MVNLEQILGEHPPITKCYIFSATLLMVLCSLDVVSPISLYLNWQLVTEEYQFWRLITCFLFFGQFGLPFFWNVYVLVFYCSSLEDVAFRTKSADFLWMLICGATMILFLTYFCGNAFFVSGAMVDLMTYVWGRRNSGTHLQLVCFSIRAPYLPYVLAFISFLMGGNIQDHLMGIAVGHTYYFFTDVYPLMPTSLGVEIFRTPRVVKWICRQQED
jgi:Derlin-2/3